MVLVILSVTFFWGMRWSCYVCQRLYFGGMKWSWYVCQRLSFGRNKVVLVCLSTTFFWEEGSGLGIIMCVQLTDHPTTGQAT